MKEYLQKFTLVELRSIVKQYNEKYSIPTGVSTKPKGELIDHIIKHAKNKEQLKSIAESIKTKTTEDKSKGVPKASNLTLKAIPRNISEEDKVTLTKIRDRAQRKIDRTIAKYEDIADGPVSAENKGKRDAEIKLIRIEWEERLKSYIS